MNALTRLPLLIVCCLAVSAAAVARTWSDRSGQYTLEAELFAFDDEHVILQRGDGQLGLFPIDVLSQADREYLRGQEARRLSRTHLDREQVWITQDGYRVPGKVVDYARQDITLHRRRGKAFVNDRQYETLPEVYRAIIRKSLEHLEGLDNLDDPALQRWLRNLQGEPRTYQIDGVVLELRDGNEYLLPFFLLSEDSRQLLEAGWEEWRAAQDDRRQQQEESFRLQSMAAAMQRERALEHEIAKTNLTLNAVRAGVTRLWEVTLYPRPGNPAAPGWVVVPGRNSEQAKANALRQHPGFVAGPIRKVSGVR